MSEQQPKTEILNTAKKSEKDKEEEVKQIIKWVNHIKAESTREKLQKNYHIKGNL